MRYIKRVETLDQNMTRAYALIYSTYCNRTLQNRIEEHANLKTTIQDDLIELLKIIQILMHDPVRARYPYASLTEAVARTLNIKQMENGNLIDYVKRFKQARDILMSHLGSNVLDQFIENAPEYRTAINDMDLPCMTHVLKVEAFGRWMAFLLLKNSIQSKYGSLLNGLTSQYSMDNNQYPKMIIAASDILAYHKHDAKPARQN